MNKMLKKILLVSAIVILPAAAGFFFIRGEKVDKDFKEITVKKGVPVTLEFVSQDRHHGFKLPKFHLSADIKPGVVEKLRFIPDKAGTFTFFCDVFCGDGHEDMSGTLKVIE